MRVARRMLAHPFVRLIRLELTRLSAPDPKSGVSTNSTTSAVRWHKDTPFRRNDKAKAVFSSRDMFVAQTLLPAYLPCQRIQRIAGFACNDSAVVCVREGGKDE